MNSISLVLQKMALETSFPNGKAFLKRDYELKWVQKITPSPLSNTYTIQLHYKMHDGLNIYVLEPKPLKLAKGATVLPHVYSTEAQKLCLYYPREREWKSSLYFTKTIIPWACEWLLHYEIWLSTGIWCGGGIHIERESDKRAAIKRQKDE